MFLNAPMESTHVNLRIRSSSLGTAPARPAARLFRALAHTSSLSAEAASAASSSSASAASRAARASTTSAAALRFRSGLLRSCDSLRSLRLPWRHVAMAETSRSRPVSVAPASASTLRHSASPARRAHADAVRFHLSQDSKPPSLVRSPAANRAAARTVSTSPLLAARWSAVCLSRSFAPARAPASRRATRTAQFPLAAATCVASVPFADASLGSAPAASSAATVSSASAGETTAAAARRCDPRGRTPPDFRSERTTGAAPRLHAARAQRSSESPPTSMGSAPRRRSPPEPSPSPSSPPPEPSPSSPPLSSPPLEPSRLSNATPSARRYSA
mmetsp:Transcript_7024/g.28559  ORF Transcript_7024/g.28559 Transcript_7024/m.28559 type:complete len:331 (+) Transcript_7024:168-1160(+)